MKYLFEICDSREIPSSKTGKYTPVGTFTVEANSEMDALNYFDNKEFDEVIKTIPADVKSNMRFQVENLYTRNLDVSIHVEGTVDFPTNIEHIHSCDLVLENDEGKKNYLMTDYKDFHICTVGENCFAADVSSYNKQNTDAAILIPEFEYVSDIPLYTDDLPGSFEIKSIESLTISVVDKNKEKAKEMEAFGEPAYHKDGYPVYQVTFDKSRIIDKDFSTNDDFTQAVTNIPTEENGQSL